MLKRNFTLIELLVVISIIAILAGILLPALSTTKDTVQTIVCGSNVKQVNQSFIMYANDNGDLFPDAAVTSGTDRAFPKRMTKDGLLTKEILSCTQKDPRGRTATVDPDIGRVQIGINVYLASGVYKPNGDKLNLRKMSSIRKPSMQLLTGEVSRFWNNDGSAPNWNNRFSITDCAWFSAGGDINNLVTRHKKCTQGNVAFVDGHLLKVTFNTRYGKFSSMDYFGHHNWIKDISSKGTPKLGYYLDWEAATSY